MSYEKKLNLYLKSKIIKNLFWVLKIDDHLLIKLLQYIKISKISL